MKNSNLFEEEELTLSVTKEEGLFQKIRKSSALVVSIIVVCVIVGYLMFKYTAPNQYQEIAEIPSLQNYFFEMDELNVNISGSKNRAFDMKIGITIYLSNEEEFSIVKNNVPIINDSFQVFLRSLKKDDIEGATGLIYLKEELVKRINKILYPVQIKDILIRNITIN